MPTRTHLKNDSFMEDGSCSQIRVTTKHQNIHRNLSKRSRRATCFLCVWCVWKFKVWGKGLCKKLQRCFIRLTRSVKDLSRVETVIEEKRRLKESDRKQPGGGSVPFKVPVWREIRSEKSSWSNRLMGLRVYHGKMLQLVLTDEILQLWCRLELFYLWSRQSWGRQSKYLPD